MSQKFNLAFNSKTAGNWLLLIMGTGVAGVAMYIILNSAL